MTNNSSPMIVDLDGSLINTDLLYESFVRNIFVRPWDIFLLPLWLMRGIAYLKYRLAQKVMIDAGCLPYNDQLIQYLKEQKKAGRRLILCTGASERFAHAITEHLGLFDEVYATNIDTNLTGSKKANLLKDKFGERGFSYVGNEAKDLKVWKFADSAVVVGPSDKLPSQVAKICQIETLVPTKKLSIGTILAQMRIHQWAKNVLLLVPLLTSHKLFDQASFSNIIVAFFCFGLCASATYIINDISDLDSDRIHWKKKTRPLASGVMPIKTGLLLCLVLFLGSGTLLALLPVWFAATLCIYVVLTLGYSFLFKRLQTVDIVVLAGLYTLRIIAGAAAIDVPLSYWLLAFSMFVFLCLALVKRISEIHKKINADTAVDKVSGRGYFVSDLSVLTSLASSAGMVSILVFAMYVNSNEVVQMYHSPLVLWLACPLFAYWIIRILIMASRGEIDEDPIAFAIKDKRSWATGILLAGVLAAAWMPSMEVLA
ncbi:UbiA family prenyltransferase [Microbulbifer bruguierae]|uniref:UbiA family prenyltransferase n=1 Tax=Microbulbifer bruguierae TaxID=3029061 RepID=A0ABY8NBY5_9GAMM|nr:UbiA family prenyltransferase [Microbulbifer bruguierae]WGL15302.1 UbiA family prenyltransferase [Microbulbifer bruguierae]